MMRADAARFAGVVPHGGRCAVDHRAVVIAHHGRSALSHQFEHFVDHPGRVAAIADEIAQKGIVGGALGLGVFKHGGEGFAIGVQIGDESNFHGEAEHAMNG